MNAGSLLSGQDLHGYCGVASENWSRNLGGNFDRSVPF